MQKYACSGTISENVETVPNHIETLVLKQRFSFEIKRNLFEFWMLKEGLYFQQNNPGFMIFSQHSAARLNRRSCSIFPSQSQRFSIIFHSLVLAVLVLERGFHFYCFQGFVADCSARAREPQQEQTKRGFNFIHAIPGAAQESLNSKSMNRSRYLSAA